MCVNYRPPSCENLHEQFGVEPVQFVFPQEVWADYLAPIVKLDEHGRPQCVLASYGMIPKSHLPQGVRYSTMNARAETIAQKPSYRQAWKRQQLALIPTQVFFEPCYESGKAERWQIGMADDSPFAVAGLWREWVSVDGGREFSFTQITINADEDPLMKRFHKPGDEKRSLVVISQENYSNWLECTDPELSRQLLTLYPAELMKGEPAPKKITSHKA